MKNKLDREFETDTYDVIGREVLDINGKVIKADDVCGEVGTGQIWFIKTGFNHTRKITGLIAVNDVGDSGDWLDVYADGELKIIANRNDENYIAKLMKEVFEMMKEETK